MLAKQLTRSIFLSLCLIATFSFTDNHPKMPSVKKNSLLVFSKTNGYRHESIEAGIAAIKKLGIENNFDGEAT